jgi:hypothetical protein
VILVDILWANLHLPDARERLAVMERTAGLCEEAGGTVHWLQSGTLTAEGRLQSVGESQLEVIPVTVLTAIVRWRAERIT